MSTDAPVSVAVVPPTGTRPPETQTSDENALVEADASVISGGLGPAAQPETLGGRTIETGNEGETAQHGTFTTTTTSMEPAAENANATGSGRAEEASSQGGSPLTPLPFVPTKPQMHQLARGLRTFENTSDSEGEEVADENNA
ncbi:hypothetical protein C8Q80DRAFT_1116426 [Daedaleopsis nitida]|nr:hypothetical protein C8Q80DRAFT_1116426 [Daedaleopsis nitida]